MPLPIGDRHRSVRLGTITDVVADWSAPYSKTSERPEMLPARLLMEWMDGAGCRRIFGLTLG